MMQSQPELPLWQDPSGTSGPPRPPGEYIDEELKARNWSQADLATILGRPLPTVNEIINAKRAILPEMAVALGRAFGTSPELWAHREAAYRLSLVNQSDGETALRARLYEMAPVKDMQKRGWLKETQSVAEMEQALCQFFGISSIDDELQMHALARKTFKGEEFSPTQRVWLVRAAKLASVLKARSFDLQTFTKGLNDLRKQAVKPDRSRFVPVILAELGVRFVIVEALPKSQIDGAAFFLDDDPSKPVIALSLRSDRMDWFWHTLAHETRHILHNDPLSLDIGLVGESRDAAVNEIELRADREAAEWLVPKAELDSFILRAKPYYPKERIAQFAARMGVHPSIVVGQLQHRGVISWKQHRDLLEKVADHVTSTSMTDGWDKPHPKV
jgi:HTH-type transcriptional regulator/antitoxin HigA